MDPLSQIMTDLLQRIVDHPAESLTPQAYAFFRQHGRLPTTRAVGKEND